MTIPNVTPYTGQVANPDGSQTQTEFTQNMFDQLSYEAQLATDINATVDGMNQTAIEVENNATSASQSAAAAEASASTAGYQGLWPDTGGSANKGDTYQTQVGGTPTGNYFTALQNTAVDPIGDNVNWVLNITEYSVGLYSPKIIGTAAQVGLNRFPLGTTIQITERDRAYFVIEAGTANGYDKIETLDSGVIARLENPTVTNEVTVGSCGALGVGFTDYTAEVLAAYTLGYNVRWGQGDYGISANIFPSTNQQTYGAGIGKTNVKALTDSNFSIFRSNGTDGIHIYDMTLDGDQANRTVPGGNGILYNAANGHFERVRCVNWPNSGILFDGQTYPCNNNKVLYCQIFDNEGVGVSQFNARFATMTGNQLGNNGLENLTIDNGSFGGSYTANRFAKHRGGCGCVGWDQSDNVRFSHNILDGENSTDAGIGDRNGICWNAVAGENLRGSIIGNTIINYPEYGINFRDRTGSGGFNSGSGDVNGNTFDNNGTDIRITNQIRPLVIFQPSASLEILEAGADVILHPNAVSLDSQMSSNQTLPFGGAWHVVNFDTALESKNITTGSSSGKWDLPLGGKYQAYVKLRITGIGGAATAVSVAINEGGSQTELINKTLDSTQTVAEMTLSPNITCNNGDIFVEARILGAAQNATIVSGGDSGFQLTYVG